MLQSGKMRMLTSDSCCVNIWRSTRVPWHAGRASWENAKEATKDTGRYLAGRAGAAADSVDRRTGKPSLLPVLPTKLVTSTNGMMCQLVFSCCTSFNCSTACTGPQQSALDPDMHAQAALSVSDAFRSMYSRSCMVCFMHMLVQHDAKQAALWLVGKSRSCTKVSTDTCMGATSSCCSAAALGCIAFAACRARVQPWLQLLRQDQGLSP